MRFVLALISLVVLSAHARADADFDRWLAEQWPAAQQLGEAASNNDAAAVQRALKAGQAADATSDEIAKDLGLTGCASSE